MQQLAQNHKVSLFSFYTNNKQLEHLSEANEIFEHVYIEYHKEKYSILNLLKGTVLSKPFSTYNYWSTKTLKKLYEITQKNRFDVIQIEHTALAQYAKYMDCSFKVLDFHNLEYEKMERYAVFQQNALKKYYAKLTAKKLKNYELRVVREFDLSLTCSNREKELLQKANPNSEIIVVPNGTDIIDEMALEKQTKKPIKSILFVGALNADKNVDAVLYFFNEILPLILREQPDILFQIVGGSVPTEIQQLRKHPNVKVLGFIKDLKAILKPGTISVVPLRYGGGTRLKITEAMAHGIPVVSTTLGCEGLDVLHNKNILIADTSESFAQCCLELISSSSKRESLIKSGYELVTKQYDWKTITTTLSEIITKKVQPK